MKCILTLDLSPTHFNPKLETIVATNAHEYGVRVMLLTGTTNQIEKEIVAILLVSRGYIGLSMEDISVCKLSVASNIWIQKRNPIYGFKRGIPTSYNIGMPCF